jgi:hypothetical protein
MFYCVSNLFKEEDYKSKINKRDIQKHNNDENAWIIINNNVYSLENKDNDLLFLFRDYYGKDVKEYIQNNFNNKEIILILEKLKKRKIGTI